MPVEKYNEFRGEFLEPYSIQSLKYQFSLLVFRIKTKTGSKTEENGLMRPWSMEVDIKTEVLNTDELEHFCDAFLNKSDIRNTFTIGKSR